MRSCLSAHVPASLGVCSQSRRCILPALFSRRPHRQGDELPPFSATACVQPCVIDELALFIRTCSRPFRQHLLSPFSSAFVPALFFSSAFVPALFSRTCSRLFQKFCHFLAFAQLVTWGDFWRQHFFLFFFIRDSYPDLLFSRLTRQNSFNVYH